MPKLNLIDMTPNRSQIKGTPDLSQMNNELVRSQFKNKKNKFHCK